MPVIGLNNAIEGAVDLGVVRYKKVLIETADVRALDTTPQELIASPGSNNAVVILQGIVVKPWSTAFSGIASGEDLTIQYTTSTPTVIATVETTGFLDNSYGSQRMFYPTSANIVSNQSIEIANSGPITAGSNLIVVLLYYTINVHSGALLYP